MKDLLLKYGIQILTLIMTLYIAKMNNKSNKKLKVLENELKVINDKKNIEYSQIQIYKVKKISDFLDFFSDYLIEDLEEKAFKKIIQNNNENSVNENPEEKIKKEIKRKLELQSELSKLLNTLILFAEDETIHRFKEFKQYVKENQKKEIEFNAKIKEISKERAERLASRLETFTSEETEMLSANVKHKKDLMEKYGLFILALRKDIGFKDTLLSAKDYITIIETL